MWALLASKVIGGVDRSRGSALMHLVTTQHALGSLGNVAFPLSRKGCVVQRAELAAYDKSPLAALLFSLRSACGQGQHPDNLSSKAREGLLLHNYGLEGAYK